MIRLLDALDLGDHPCTAIVGAGGKTSTLFRVAKEMGGPVLLSNSAHLAVGEKEYADRTFVVGRGEELPDFLAGGLEGIALVTGPADERGRFMGLPVDELYRLHLQAIQVDVPFLIEADGSRMLPLKAPAEHEPPIPKFVDSVIVVAGVSGLGKPLDGEVVFRPEIFGRLAGMALGEPITPDHLAKVLCHPDGGLKNIPQGAKRVLVLNQADTPERQDLAESVARRCTQAFSSVVVASLHGKRGADPEVRAVYRQVAGIVLAAGASTRLGRPKQLLEWQNEPLVTHILRVAINSGVDPVVLVCGAAAEEVKRVVSGLPVQVVENTAWREGQSASLRAGLNSLPKEVGAAVFFLVDQPYISTELVQRILWCYTHSLAPVVAPVVKGRRGNPVLFDRRTFPDLLALQGDTGGRKVIERWPLETVDWEDENIFQDVDTPEDYHKLNSTEGNSL